MTDTLSAATSAQAPEVMNELPKDQAQPKEDIKEVIQRLGDKVDVTEKVIKVADRESRIFLLSNDKRRGTVELDLEEDVIDPATGKQRRMRLLRGAQTIWFDEQPPTVFPESYVKKNILMMKFVKGKCIIPVRDELMLKAAELTSRNVAVQKKLGTKARPKDIYFYEWDPVEQNAKAIAEENNVIKAMQLAMTIPMTEVIPHAAYLNIPTHDEQGFKLEDDALRTAYIRVAKNQSAKFLNSIHSPIVTMKHMVRKAVNASKIDLGRQPGAAYWTDGGFITTLPEGRDEVDYLVEFAMIHGDANTAFANQLRALSE